MLPMLFDITPLPLATPIFRRFRFLLIFAAFFFAFRLSSPRRFSLSRAVFAAHAAAIFAIAALSLMLMITPCYELFLADRAHGAMLLCCARCYAAAADFLLDFLLAHATPLMTRFMPLMPLDFAIDDAAALSIIFIFC